MTLYTYEVHFQIIPGSIGSKQIHHELRHLNLIVAARRIANTLVVIIHQIDKQRSIIIIGCILIIPFLPCLTCYIRV